MGPREEVTKLAGWLASWRGWLAGRLAVKPKPKKKREISSNLASDKTMLRPGEAAQLLGVHANTIRRWADQGVLRAYIISSRGDRRFRRTEIESFLKQGRRRWER